MFNCQLFLFVSYISNNFSHFSFHRLIATAEEFANMRHFSLFLIFTVIAQSMGENFEGRKANLVKILQNGGEYHSSYSYYHRDRNHHYKHHHYHSASVERAERKQFEIGVFYGKVFSRYNPRRFPYPEYPCTYNYYIPYGNSYGPCRK